MTEQDPFKEKLNELKRKSVLLGKFRNKVIKLQEFEEECAKWSIEMLDQFVFLPLPEKPKSVDGYELLPMGVKTNLAQEYFNDHPEIMEYYRERLRIRNLNQATYDWLKHCHKIVPDGELGKKLEQVPKECLCERKGRR